MMITKNIILIVSALFCFFISCNGQKKEEKQQVQIEKIYSAKCEGDYSTGEKIGDKEKHWTLSETDIDKIMKLSREINENEFHYTYPVTPCNIDVENYTYNGKTYNLQINGGSYLSLYDGGKTVILGCDAPECAEFFLKSQEEMATEENESIVSGKTAGFQKHNLYVNKNKVLDFLIIKKANPGFELNIEIDGKSSFNKKFNCDILEIDTSTKYNQSFNLKLLYTDQYQKVFRTIVIPVYYTNKDFVIKKIFVATLETSAKTGLEMRFNREIAKSSSLNELDIDAILSD